MHPKKLGRYELVRVLGKGAMGVVYEGSDPNLDRRVAIKTIMVDALGSAAGAEYEARFRVEARSAARLLHPNIVTVYDSDRDGDTAFLVMEFVEGDDLKQHLDRGELYPPAEALRLITDMLAALDFAHRQGVVHRDVKPANLLVERPGGRVKLTDFGVARIAGEATRTQGSMIGTLKYMAPEQVQGQKVDTRADLFSAGVVAYQLLTGARPFDGDNDFSIIHQVIGHEPPAPSAVVPGLPKTVDAVLARALAKDREQRFQTGDEFSQALRQAFASVDMTTLAAPPAQPANVAAQPSLPLHRVATIPGTMPGTAISQELELEYWRDVRDATDPRELEGFLLRFPEGVYADLARRRLARLLGPDDDPERTVLRGMTLPPNQVPAVPTVPTIPVPRPTVQPAVAPAIETTLSDPLAELAEASMPRPRKAPAAAKPTPAPAVSAEAPQAPASPASQPAKLKAPLWAGLAAVLVIAGGVAAWSARSRPAAEATPAAAPVASAPVAAASEPVPSASTAAVAARPASAASVPQAVASQAASAPRPVVAKAPVRRASAPASAPAPVTTTLTPALPPERREDTSAAAARPAAPKLVPPAETCKDKFFLAKEFCLQTECAKPGYATFPACIKLKEEAKLREDSKVRN